MEPALSILDLETVTEGATTWKAPRSAHLRGPKAREGVPFYNPSMRVARDVSVSLLNATSPTKRDGWDVCDAMCATGARGLRLANEAPKVRLTLADANPEAVALAAMNARSLGIETAAVLNERLEAVLGRTLFDWVDIDPFGTPAGFLASGIVGTRGDGVLAVTATDTAALSGVYEQACYRRYGARPRRGACMPELATRILVGAIARTAGARDRGIRPLLAYASQHYVRVYVQILDGARNGDASVAQLGYANFDDGRPALGPEPGRDAAGPLWTGPLVDAQLAPVLPKAAARLAGITEPAKRLLRRIAEEATSPPLYVTAAEVLRGRHGESLGLDAALEGLRQAGFVATRTHFDDHGIKTDADPDDVRRFLSKPKAP